MLICLLAVGIAMPLCTLSTPSSQSVNKDRDGAHRRSVDANAETEDEDEQGDIDLEQWRESVCPEAVKLLARNRHAVKLNPLVLRTFCFYCRAYEAAATDGHETVCDTEDQEVDSKRKRQQVKKEIADRQQRQSIKRQLTKRIAA